MSLENINQPGGLNELAELLIEKAIAADMTADQWENLTAESASILCKEQIKNSVFFQKAKKKLRIALQERMNSAAETEIKANVGQAIGSWLKSNYPDYKIESGRNMNGDFQIAIFPFGKRKD